MVSAYQYGQPVSVTRYDGNGQQVGQTVYGYDYHGRQSQTTDARNGTTITLFNNADLVQSVTTPPPAQTNTTYYDQSLRATNIVQPDNTSVFVQYYPSGLREQTYGSRTYPVSYTYDAQDRVQTMTTWRNTAVTNTAAVTTWSYDPYRGWLTGKSYNNGQTAGPTYSNTPGGRLATRTWARGIQTTYGYNNAGDLASVSYSGGATNLSYNYDRRGRQTAVTQGSATASLAYNDAGQLLSESVLRRAARWAFGNQRLRQPPPPHGSGPPRSDCRARPIWLRPCFAPANGERCQ